MYEKIEVHLKPICDELDKRLNVDGISEEMFDCFNNKKIAIIELLGRLYHRFSSKSEPNYLPEIRLWLKSLIEGENRYL